MTIQAPRSMQLGQKQKRKGNKPNRWRRHRSDTSLWLLKRNERAEKMEQEKKRMREVVRAREEEGRVRKNTARKNTFSRLVRRSRKLVYTDISRPATNRCFGRHYSGSSAASALAAESLSLLLTRSAEAEASPLEEASAPDVTSPLNTAEKRDCDLPKSCGDLTNCAQSTSSVPSLYHADLHSSSSSSSRPSVKSEDPANDIIEFMELQDLLDECEVDMEELPEITQSEIEDLGPADLAGFYELIHNWDVPADLESEECSSSCQLQDDWKPHFTTPGIFTCAGCTETRLSASGASMPSLPLPAKAGQSTSPGHPSPDLCCPTWTSTACILSVRAAPSSARGVSQLPPSVHADRGTGVCSSTYSDYVLPVDEGFHEVQRLSKSSMPERAEMFNFVSGGGSNEAMELEERRKALLERCARTIHQNYPEITLDKLNKLKQLQKSRVLTALAALAQDSDTPRPRCFRGSRAVTSTPTPVDIDCRGAPLYDTGSPAIESVTKAQSPLPPSHVPADSPCSAQLTPDTDHRYCRPSHDEDCQDSLLALRLGRPSTDSAFSSDSALGSESEDEHGFGRMGSCGRYVDDRRQDSDAKARTSTRAEQWAEVVKDTGSDSVYGSDDEFCAQDSENCMSDDDGNYHSSNKILDDDKNDRLDHDVTMWDDSGYVAKKPTYHKMGFLSDSEDEGDEGPLEQTMVEASRDWVFDLEWSQNHHGSVLVL